MLAAEAVGIGHTRSEQATVRGGLAYAAPASGVGIQAQMQQRAVQAQQIVAEEHFMDAATSGLDDELDDYYEQMVGRTVERRISPPKNTSEDDVDDQDGSHKSEDSMVEDGGVEEPEISVGSLSTISMRTDTMDAELIHPTLRIRPRRRAPSMFSTLGKLDVTTRGRRAAGGRSTGRRSASRRRSYGMHSVRSAAELYKQPSADEGGPARVTAHVQLKMDSPRDGTSEGYTRGNPMMAALKGGSRSQDFHKSMSHQDLNQLLHSFGMSVTKDQVEQLVSRSYRRSSKSTRFSPPRERSPSPTERRFVASVLQDIKSADGTGREWSRVTAEAASRHGDAISVLSEESSQVDDYNMERPPMNIIVSSGYRKTALPRRSPVGDLTQPETSSRKRSALMTPSQRAALRKSLKGIGPKALVRAGGLARFDAHQKNAQKGTTPAHEWTVTVAEEGGSDLQPYLEAVVFRLSEKLWDQSFVVCEQPPYQLALGAMNSPLRMCGPPVTVELRLRAGGAFKVLLKLDTAPNPVHQPWNTLAMAPSRKLSCDVVTAQKLRQEKEQRLQAQHHAARNRQKEEWEEWKMTEAKVRAAEASLREQHKKTKEEVQDLRKLVAEKDNHAAAARIQSAHRGRLTRRDVATNLRKNHEQDDDINDHIAPSDLLAQQADHALSQIHERGFLALESEWTKSAVRARVTPPSDKTAVSEAVSAAVLALLGRENSPFVGSAPVYSLIEHARSIAGWETGLPLFLQELRNVRADIDAGKVDAARVRAAHSHIEICVDADGKLIKSIVNAKEESAKLIAALCRIVMFTVAYATLVAEAWEQERAATTIQARHRGNAGRAYQQQRHTAAVKLQARQRGIMSRKLVQSFPKTLIGISNKSRYYVSLTRLPEASQNAAGAKVSSRAARPSSAGQRGRTEHSRTLVVTCPEHIQSSRLLVVKAPFGEDIEIVVPSLEKEVRGGDVFQVKLEAVDENSRAKQVTRTTTRFASEQLQTVAKNKAHAKMKVQETEQGASPKRGHEQYRREAQQREDTAAKDKAAAEKEETARLAAEEEAATKYKAVVEEVESARVAAVEAAAAKATAAAEAEEAVAKAVAEEEEAVQLAAEEEAAGKAKAAAEQAETARVTAVEEAAAKATAAADEEETAAKAKAAADEAETARVTAMEEAAGKATVAAGAEEATAEAKAVAEEKEEETAQMGAVGKLRSMPDSTPEPAMISESEVGIPARQDRSVTVDAVHDDDFTSVPQSQEYVCVRRSIIRQACELTSDQAADSYLDAGEHIVALEERLTADGIRRVRFDRGWISRKSKTGQFILMSEKEFFSDSADTNGDGIITEHEFRLWHLKFLGTAPGVEELAVFYAADTDGDGSISAKEFDSVKPLFLDPALRAKAAQENWRNHVESTASLVLSAKMLRQKAAASVGSATE